MMMSARKKPPTEDQKTDVYDTGRSRTVRPTQKGLGRPSDGERKRVVELTTPTQVDPPPSSDTPALAGPPLSASPDPLALRVISMKTPAELAAERREREGREHVVKMRAISEVSRHDTPTNLGRLAPPRDPAGARARRLREVVIWGSAVLLVASVVTLGIWLIAR